jgi:hypothetical protein
MLVVPVSETAYSGNVWKQLISWGRPHATRCYHPDTLARVVVAGFKIKARKYSAGVSEIPCSWPPASLVLILARQPCFLCGAFACKIKHSLATGTLETTNTNCIQHLKMVEA